MEARQPYLPARLQFADALDQHPLLFVSILFLVSALIRTLLGMLTPTPWVFTDEIVYWELSKSLSSGHWLEWRSQPYEFQQFLYPLYLTPASWLTQIQNFGVGYQLAKILNSLAICATVFPAFGLARQYLSNEKAFWVAVLSVAIPAVGISGLIMAENLFYPAVVLGVYLLQRAYFSSGLRYPILAGMVLALAYYVKPQGLVFLPVTAFTVGMLILVQSFENRSPDSFWKKFFDSLLDKLRQSIPLIFSYGIVMLGMRMLIAYLETGSLFFAPSEFIGAYSTEASQLDSSIGSLPHLRMMLGYLFVWVGSVGIFPFFATIKLVVDHLAYGKLTQKAVFLMSTTAGLTGVFLITFALFTVNFSGKIHERYFFMVAPLIFTLALYKLKSRLDQVQISRKIIGWAGYAIAMLLILGIGSGVFIENILPRNLANAPTIGWVYTLKKAGVDELLLLGGTLALMVAGALLVLLKNRWKLKVVLTFALLLLLNVGWLKSTIELWPNHTAYLSSAQWINQYVSPEDTMVYVCDGMPRYPTAWLLRTSEFWVQAEKSRFIYFENCDDPAFMIRKQEASLVDGRIPAVESIPGNVFALVHNSVSLDALAVGELDGMVLYNLKKAPQTTVATTATDTTTPNINNTTTTNTTSETGNGTESSIATNTPINPAISDPLMSLTFDEGTGKQVFDVSGYGQDALICNGEWVSSRDGFGLHLSEIGDFAVVPNFPIISNQEAFAVALWTYISQQPNNPQENDFRYFLHQRATRRYGIGLILEQDLTVNGALFLGLDSPVQRLRSEKAIPLHRWTHVVFSYDSNQQLARIYIDGEIVAEELFVSHSDVVDVAPLFVGSMFSNRSRGGGGLRFLPGIVDDVMVFGHALTSQDVADLMQKPATPAEQSVTTTPVQINITLDSQPADARLILHRPDMPQDPCPEVHFTGVSEPGVVQFELQPGEYDVEVESGVNFTTLSERIRIQVSDAPIEQTVALESQTNPAAHNYYSADLHLHSWASHDGMTNPEAFLVSQLAAGLDVAFVSDHNTSVSPERFAFGHRNLLDFAGLREMPVILGMEMTTEELGHLVTYPLEEGSYIETEPEKTALEYAKEARRYGASVVQAAHPLSGGIREGYFFHKAEPLFTASFDAIEVLNLREAEHEYRFDTNRATLEEAFAFWNRGARYTAVAVTDNHDAKMLYPTVGSARTYVYVDGLFSADTFLQSLQNQHAFVSAGPMIYLTANGGAIPGDDVWLTPGDAVQLQLQIESIQPLQEVRITRNGETVAQLPVAGNVASLNWEDVPQSDGWYAVEVFGEDPKYWAMTNPVWVNLDQRPSALEAMQTNLVAHWAMDGGQPLIVSHLELYDNVLDGPLLDHALETIDPNVFDRSLNHLHGKLEGGASWVESDAAEDIIAPRSVRFNGTNGHIVVPYKGTLGLTDAITISAWLLLESDPDSTDANDWRLILGHQGTGFRPYGLVMEQNGRLVGSVHVDNQRQTVVSTDVVPIGQWTHVAFTYNAVTGVGRLYMNGQLHAETQGITGQFPVLKRDLVISRPSRTEEHNGWPGRMADLRIYSRDLTSEEIAFLIDSN